MPVKYLVFNIAVMEELTLTTPSILFSAISLIMLAYTNRFLAYAQVIRNLKGEHENRPSAMTKLQLDNLRKRLYMVVVLALVDLALQRIVPAGLLVVVVVLLAIQVDNHGTDFLRNLDLRDFPSDKFVGNLHFVSFPSGSKDGGTQKSLWLKTPTDPANPKMNAKSQRWGIFTRNAVYITVFQGLMHPIVLMAISDY